MSIPAVAAGFRVTDLTPPERLVVLAYAYAACEHGYTWISVAKVSRRVEMDERSVRRILRRLEDRGLVDVVHRGGGNRSSLIRVLGLELADDDCEKIAEYESRFNVDPGPQVRGVPRATPDPGSPLPGPAGPLPPDPPVPSPRTQEPGEPSRTAIEPSLSPRDAAELWAQITGVVLTPAVLRSWVGPAADFLAAAPPDLDVPAFLTAAAQAGCRGPAGWPYFLDAHRPVRRRVREPCGRCADRRWLYRDDTSPERTLHTFDALPAVENPDALVPVPCPDCAGNAA